MYVATFVEETGYRWVYSVDSRGVRQGFRTVPPGADISGAVEALWVELNRSDPLWPAGFSPARLPSGPDGPLLA